MIGVKLAFNLLGLALGLWLSQAGGLFAGLALCLFAGLACGHLLRGRR